MGGDSLYGITMRNAKLRNIYVSRDLNREGYRGYRRIQEDIDGYRKIHGDTGGYRGIQEDTGGHRGIQEDTEGHRGIQRDTGGYIVIQRNSVYIQFPFIHIDTGEYRNI